MRFSIASLFLYGLCASTCTGKEITTVYVIKKRAAIPNVAVTCTTYTTILNLIPGLFTSSCTYQSVSGPSVTQVCTGLPLVAICGAATTATTCSPLASTLTTLRNVLGIPTATQLAAASTCSNAIYPPAAATPVSGTNCYADMVGGVRSLNGPSTSSNTMTNAQCASFCTGQGFAYSGTEFGNECYCGNTLPTTTSTGCTMVCAGAAAGSLDACGGMNALSVTTNSALVNQNNQQSAVLASYTSQGCYSDAYPTRVLSAASTTSTAMSLESCAAFCNTGSYTLFGVEYGSECYCGNSILTDGSTYGVSGASGCSYGCSGKSSQICGGSNVLNLYSKTPTVVTNNPNSVPFVPQPVAANGYAYLNCYSDNNGGRTLSVNMGSINNVGSCVTQCQTAGFRYAGVEFRSECWCDNVIQSTGSTIDARNCNYQCNGAPTQNCGGANAIAIYQGTASGTTVPLTANGFTFVDTYRDNPANRILPQQMGLSSYTVNNCVQACSNAGFTYAGVEFARECWCGSSLRAGLTGGLAPNMACTGNTAQFCGGSRALQTYTGVSAPQYLTTPFANGQCVIGSPNGQRALSTTMPASDNMTPAVCRSLCTGFTYYGVEYGRECYCGNSFPSQTPFSQSCNMPCSGDAAQNCGGSNALRIFNS